MDMDSIMNAVMENLIVPILAVLGTTLVLIVENCLKKIADSIVNKNAMSDMEKETATRKKLLDTIESCVAAAVGSNMQLADQMKESGESLTDDQVKQLNENAKKIVYSSLPTSLTSEDGALMKIIGGPDKLDSIIDAYMEKYVYEYKIKKMQAAPLVLPEARMVKLVTPVRVKK